MFVLPVTLATAWLAIALGAAPQAGEKGRPFLECEAEVASSGGPATSSDARAKPKSRPRAPRLLRRGPALDYSGLGNRRGSGNWMGEALIGADGHIKQVWTHRSPVWEPAWPEFDELVAASLRTRVYEPTIVDGSAVPVCLVMTVNITWRR